MHPLLIPPKRLRASRAWRIGATTGLFGALVLVVFLGAQWPSVSSAPASPSSGRVPSAPATSPRPVENPVRGTRVPQPPGWSGLEGEPDSRSRGEYLFRAARMTRPASVKLFEFYVSSMSASGWTLMGQSEPDARGEWALSWRDRRQTASLYLYLVPRVSLTLDYCPPLKYC